MKVNKLVPKEHKYYDTVIKIAGDAEVIENLELQITPTLKSIFILCENTLGQEKSKYIFLVVNYLGVALSKPTDYKDAKWRYDSAIRDTRAGMAKEAEKTDTLH